MYRITGHYHFPCWRERRAVTALRHAGADKPTADKIAPRWTSVPRLTVCDREWHPDHHDTTVPWPMVILMSRRIAARSICQLPRATRAS